MQKGILGGRLGQHLRCLFPAEIVFFLCIWTGLMGAGRDRLFRDPGTFWHVVLGEHILHTARVPTADTFTFTRSGRPFVADQWLAEALMALCHRLAGWEGLLLLSATLLAGVYAWIGGRLIQAGISPLWSAGILAGVLLASAHNFHVRPLLVTILFQAVWFAGLLAVEAGRVPIKRLWLLAPLAVLWANLHGGVLAGLGTLAMTAALWIFLGWWAGRGLIHSLPGAIRLGVIVVVSFLAVLVNPYGVGLPQTWYSTLQMNLGEWIQEHRPWHVREPAGWAAIVLLLGYLSLLFSAAKARKFQAAWIVPIVWFVMGLQRVRNLPLFAVTAALAIAELFSATQEAASQEPEAERDCAEGAGPPASSPSGRTWRRCVLPGILVLMAFGLQTAGWKVPLLGSHWVRLSPDRWPVGLLPELQAASGQSPEGSRIFNDLDFGGFLIYFTPRWRIFIDDRCALYGEDFLRAYDQARRQEPGQLDRWQTKYGFRWALVHHRSRFDRYLSAQPAWKCLGRDQAAAWYQWQGPAHASLEKGPGETHQD